MTLSTRALALAAALLAALAGTTAAQPPPVPKKSIQFAAGASSATITATLVGDETVDYTVRAAAGQTLAVTLKHTGSRPEFNVLPPGSNDVAFFNSSMTGEPSYTGMLADDGTYSIRVYLMRAAARRKEKSTYTLTVSITGKPLPALPAAADALVKGTRYHASAPIPCTPPYAQPTECEAGVVRRGRDGTGTVEITAKGQVIRRILFVAGKPVASDSGDPVSATRKDDLITVSVGDERYSFPDALLTGG
jgi:hypothetical protein